VTLPHPPAAHNGSSSHLGVSGAAPPDCDEVLARFWDYLDGRCSSELAGRIGAHVEACPPCRRVRSLQERFFECLGQMRERSHAPARVHDRVRKALAAERWGRAR
jgi:mycothiol system anti-sigma-R factor